MDIQSSSDAEDLREPWDFAIAITDSFCVSSTITTCICDDELQRGSALANILSPPSVNLLVDTISATGPEDAAIFNGCPITDESQAGSNRYMGRVSINLGILEDSLNEQPGVFWRQRRRLEWCWTSDIRLKAGLRSFTPGIPAKNLVVQGAGWPPAST
ncbi:uncharacterized protein ARMOST_02469 [Armillaria ostoyae]|uniref:Uncharacterized protein n=1 Tax=Armillaria ostoyae TaxID=47428 RepID=A0A284QRS4_ARMOS|nr:uncharacterized protein ARMOST_02469 [Armillaria ostoyae]